MDNFLWVTFIYLATAVIVVPISQRLGLGSVLGYLIAGVLVGQVSGIGEDHQSLLAIGELGVVMMLFLIGLELEPKLLWKMRFKLVGMGGLQVIASIILISLFSFLLVRVWQQAIAIGMVLALSSTAIVLQTLREKGLEKTIAGQAMFSVLLFQDVAVIPIIALMSLLVVSTQGSWFVELADASVTELLLDGSYALLMLGVVCGAVGLGYLLSKPVFNYIARTRLSEMFTASALLLVVGSALLMHHFELSPALGTFIAGVVLARSRYVHEIRSSIEPFKGLLLGLFFVGVGLGMDLNLIATKPVELIVTSLVLILVKLSVLLVIARLFNLSPVSSWLFALGLSQAGEFGFVLITFALVSGIITQQLGDEIVAIITISMLLTPLLFILYYILERRISRDDTQLEYEASQSKVNVVIAGTGRFGQTINCMLMAHGYQTIVVDRDAPLLNTMKRMGLRAWFGDMTKPQVLQSIGLDKAELLVVAIDDIAAAVELVSYARRQYPGLQILARAHDRAHLYALQEAGADDVLRETYDSSVHCAKKALMMLGMKESEAEEQTKIFVDYEMASVEQLYEVWEKNKDLANNQEYLSTIKNINEGLRTIMQRNRKKRKSKQSGFGDSDQAS